jgi:hypothetical protein
MSALNKLTVEKLTASYLSTNYLWGVPLYDRAGHPMPPLMIQTHINNAIGKFEKFTGGNLSRKVIKSAPVDEGLVLGIDYHEVIERLPFNSKHIKNFIQIQLPHSGILSVERVRGIVHGPALEFDANSFRITHPNEGIIQIIPTAITMGWFANFSLYPSSNATNMPIVAGSHFPAFWAVDYTIGPSAGFQSDGGLGADLELGVAYVDDDIGEWICKTAAIDILNIASTAHNPGVASKSISFDGFSRSVSTTASAIYALYSAQIDQYKKDLEKINLAKYRKRIRGLRIYG